jgi:hypothetical protein
MQLLHQGNTYIPEFTNYIPEFTNYKISLILKANTGHSRGFI